MSAAGTTPPGAHSEEQAARWVRDMFSQVAPRYDLLNHLLSFQIDRYWRARTVKRVRPILERPGARILDICCGTGDLLQALARVNPSTIGSDFCHPMLIGAQKKTGKPLFEADALRLPLRDASLDLLTVAFGVRNFANYRTGLAEIRRVLKPGGLAAILEFSRPPNPAFRALYDFYSRHLLPRIGGAISGSSSAYSYLPESVRKFPDGPGLAQALRDTGFSQVEFEYLTAGIVALHLATK